MWEVYTCITVYGATSNTVQGQLLQSERITTEPISVLLSEEICEIYNLETLAGTLHEYYQIKTGCPVLYILHTLYIIVIIMYNVRNI
jgi:hypothetical protein